MKDWQCSRLVGYINSKQGQNTKSYFFGFTLKQEDMYYWTIFRINGFSKQPVESNVKADIIKRSFDTCGIIISLSHW